MDSRTCIIQVFGQHARFRYLSVMDKSLFSKYMGVLLRSTLLSEHSYTFRSFYAKSKDSGETARTHALAWAFAAR